MPTRACTARFGFAMPIGLNAILVSIVVPSLLELSQNLVSNLIIQLSVCITIVGNQGVEAIFSEAAPSAKISRALWLVRFSGFTRRTGS